MCNNSSEATEKKVADLQKEVEDLKKRLSPDAIAKTLDHSFLSVGNLRAFLQILSIILTIFVAGAVYFGYIGTTNIFKIREEAKKTETIRQSTQTIFDRVSQIEGQIGDKVAKVDRAIPTLKAKTNAEIEKLRQKVDGRIQEVDDQVKYVTSELKNISEIFNKIVISNPTLLNAREQQLLILMAKEIDPGNPTFNFNAAYLAFSFRRYDEALKSLDVVLNSENVPQDIRKKAMDLKVTAESRIKNPPKLEYEEPSGAFIGPYGIIAFPVNILKALVYNGYLTQEQAQEIIEASKKK